MRHIVSLSGGKDSSALAIYLNNRVYWANILGKNISPINQISETINYEYVFCDTDKELPETYDFLDKLENVLKKKIIRLNAGKGFDNFLEHFNGFLPSAKHRWCTLYLKIKPFENFIGKDNVYSYIGIRSDEDREGYKVSSKNNIIPVYPFKEDKINHEDVLRILNDSGLGYPEYYKWRTRSGCYFCFFQKKIEWVGLLENHPELFEKAKEYEKHDDKNNKHFTWSYKESLDDLSKPERIYQIKKRADRKKELENNKIMNKINEQRSLFEYLPDDVDELSDDDINEKPCMICE